MKVFITGGTGYMGSRLIPLLIQRGHEVTGVVRKGSGKRLPAGAAPVLADPLQMDSYTEQVRGADTFVHLIGVAHPSPAKAKEFREIDLVSVQVAVRAARDAGIRHFVYLSVAQPARMMQAFIALRSEGEKMIRESGMAATFVRPWYVLGPGHRWAYVLLPFYWVCERLPATRESARRLGLVTIWQMLDALVWAVENPAEGVRILDVPKIRKLSGR
ncbi:MAG TPA: NAD(P)H-binding protein [Chthoniobacterales bacterium]|nr:NAD(P)H-binding protein [Chthoniobacterales bacterium]